MKRLLLLVESNTTSTGRLFAQRAAALGITPVMLTTSPARYPYIAHDAVDYVETETSDPGAVLAAARALGRDADIAGAFSSSEYYIETAAVCAKALGLPGPPPEAIRACRHKGTQRQILAAAGLGGPRFVRASTVAGVLAAGIPYPVVVKRLAGGMIPDLVLRAYGTDLIDSQIRAAVGLPVPSASAQPCAAASIRFLTAAGPGSVAHPDRAIAAACAVEGVADAEIYRVAGEGITAAEDFRGRIGHVISVSGRADQAAPEAAERGLDELRTALRPAAGSSTTGASSTAKAGPRNSGGTQEQKRGGELPLDCLLGRRWPGCGVPTIGTVRKFSCDFTFALRFTPGSGLLLSGVTNEQ